MEEEISAIKRRNVPSPVIIPADLAPTPPIKPHISPSANGHHYRLLPPSSSSSSSSPSSSVSAAADFDLASFKSSPMSYTSLKDIIASSLILPPPTTPSAAAGSSSASDPSASSPGGASTLEISIRNRLVKQAAWAYLQPMASSPSASGRRLWSFFAGDFIKPWLSSVKRVLVDWAGRSCNWLADALWLLLCR